MPAHSIDKGMTKDAPRYKRCPGDVLDRFILTHSNLQSDLRLALVFLDVSVLEVDGMGSKGASRKPSSETRSPCPFPLS